jgi:hypothetical protein
MNTSSSRGQGSFSSKRCQDHSALATRSHCGLRNLQVLFPLRLNHCHVIKHQITTAIHPHLNTQLDGGNRLKFVYLPRPNINWPGQRSLCYHTSNFNWPDPRHELALSSFAREVYMGGVTGNPCSGKWEDARTTRNAYGSADPRGREVAWGKFKPSQQYYFYLFWNTSYCSSQTDNYNSKLRDSIEEWRSHAMGWKLRCLVAGHY